MFVSAALLANPWVAIPLGIGKAVWGFLRALPWQAWVAVVLLLLAWAYGHIRYNAGEDVGIRQGAAERDRLAEERDRLIERIDLMKAASTRAAELDRAAHAKQAAAMTAAEQKFTREKADALAEKDRVIAGLRAGNLQLREHWQGCRAAAGTGAGQGAGQRDEAADLRAAGAGDLVRLGREANAEVTYLQGLIASASRCFKITPE